MQSFLSPGRHQHQAEAAFGVQIERLNQELCVKTQTIQDLSRTVERLQKEKKNMLSIPVSRPQSTSAENKCQATPLKTLNSARAAEICGGVEQFPDAQCEKTYQPSVFTGRNVKFTTVMLPLHAEKNIAICWRSEKLLT